LLGQTAPTHLLDLLDLLKYVLSLCLQRLNPPQVTSWVGSL